MADRVLLEMAMPPAFGKENLAMARTVPSKAPPFEVLFFIPNTTIRAEKEAKLE